MLKHISRNNKNKMNIQDISSSFLCLREFYNSIPDYSDINHLSEKQFNEKLQCLKKKQHELTKFKRRRHCEQMHNNCHRVLDESSSTSPTDVEHIAASREKFLHIKRESASENRRPKSTVSQKKNTGSALSNIEDDYELFNSLRNCRSKSISPIRGPSRFNENTNLLKNDDEKFYSDITNDHIPAVDHQKPHKRPASSKKIPITSRIPLYDLVMADQQHKSQIVKLDSAIKLQSQMKPFQFSESRCSTRRCLSRSLSSPHLNFSDNDSETDANNDKVQFKATPFPKNLFCNYYQYKMWENNYFRALNKKLRAEELLKASKLPPSMAKRDEENKINEMMHEQEARSASVQTEIPNIEILRKKKRTRKKMKRSKSNAETSNVRKYDYSAYYKTYNLDKKKKEIKEKVKKIQDTSNDNKANSAVNQKSENSKFSPTPLYPVNRPNLAALLRYEWSREKLKQMKDEKDRMIRDKFRKTQWGVNKTYAFQQLCNETTNEEEISMRLATRLAEQKLRMQEHEMNMELIKQRVMQKPLLLEGPQKLEFEHSAHNCDNRVDIRPKSSINLMNKFHSKSSMRTKLRPDSSDCSTDSNSKSGSSNSKSTMCD